MRCPVCGKEMAPGGLVSQGVVLGWVPMDQFRKKGLRRLMHMGVRTIGRSSALLGQTLVPGAWYCAECNTVTGTFAVTNRLEST